MEEGSCLKLGGDGMTHDTMTTTTNTNNKENCWVSTISKQNFQEKASFWNFIMKLKRKRRFSCKNVTSENQFSNKMMSLLITSQLFCCNTKDSSSSKSPWQSQLSNLPLRTSFQSWLMTPTTSLRPFLLHLSSRQIQLKLKNKGRKRQKNTAPKT